MDIYRCFFRPGIEKVAKFPYVRTSVDKRLSKENYNTATLGRIFSPSRKSTCCRLLRYVCVSKLVKFLRILLFQDCNLMYLTFLNQPMIKKYDFHPHPIYSSCMPYSLTKPLSKKSGRTATGGCRCGRRVMSFCSRQHGGVLKNSNFAEQKYPVFEKKCIPLHAIINHSP